MLAFERTSHLRYEFGSRRGTTLFEVTVTLAIIAVLVALIVPAVGKARVSMARVQCRSHLRQIGLGLHQYHELHGRLPHSASTSLLERTYGDAPGWHYAILPFVDQTPLYDDLSPIVRTGMMQDSWNRNGRLILFGDTVLTVFRCPLSLLPAHAERPEGGSRLAPHAVGYASSDYKGSSGSESTGVLIPGVSGPSVRFADIVNGLSNVIAVGESSTPGFEGARWPLWIGLSSPGSNTFSTASPMIASGWMPPPRYWLNTGYENAMSFHGGTCPFLFCDGAVTELSESIDPIVYLKLGVRDAAFVREF